jgi:hypothetical protein
VMPIRLEPRPIGIDGRFFGFIPPAQSSQNGVHGQALPPGGERRVTTIQNIQGSSQADL